ncbi:MAG TPA: phasin family protein [Bradyrhizobium sp.]|uniref:phasin family protein n=1 Tax=Bradyrhizobium sp. TaxID=376 RepID=UPI002BD209B3|nr:phasin family protein [Bradyrhizobium sp.]HLZ01828.1 phasin family protein [Bradyrhizobium sp.]
MSKSSSRRSPNEQRPARRSLVELTAAASRAVDEALPVAPTPSTPAAASPAETSTTTAVAGEAAAEAPAVLPEAATAARPEGSALSASDNTADMAVKIAKEFQAGALDDFRLSINAALDYARHLVETRPPAAGASKGDPAARPEDPVRTGLQAAAQYHAEFLELAKANVETALDHAHELIGARTRTEFVEVSSRLARKQCEFALRQAGALKSFARTVTKSDPK